MPPGLFRRGLSARERTLLVVAFLVLYSVAFIFIVYQPYTERIGQLRTELAKERDKLEAARSVYHRLRDIEARISELSEEMANLDLLVPGDNRVAHFLYYCWQWERETGARVRNLTFADPVTAGAYQEHEIRFTVHGPYQAQVAFLARLEGMNRLVRVDSVRLLPLEVTKTGSDAAATYAMTDMIVADYRVHLFVDPGKAAQAAQEEPGAGLEFTLPIGRRTPFLP